MKFRLLSASMISWIRSTGPTLWALALMIGGGGNAIGGLVLYTDQSSYQANSGGLATQTFDQVASIAGVGAGGIAMVNNPLNHSTNSGILNGLTITASTSLGGDLSILGVGYAGNSNTGVASTYGGSLSFSQGTTSTSLDVISLFSVDMVEVTFLDEASNVLGSTTVNTTGSGAGVFIGATDYGGPSIALIVISSKDSGFVGADRVQFGFAVPEPSTIVLTLLGTACLGGFQAVRKR